MPSSGVHRTVALRSRSCVASSARTERGVIEMQLHKRSGVYAIGVLQIALFGSLRVSVDDRPITAINTNRLHSLMAWLILKGDKPQPKERIASLLWPESSGPQARTNLRQLLHHLKRSLPSDCACLRS